jgi:hypothetical protein
MKFASKWRQSPQEVSQLDGETLLGISAGC